MYEQFEPIKYFEYYRLHTYYVVLAWLDIRDILLQHKVITIKELQKINSQITWHDNSKISKEEFEAYGTKFYPKNLVSEEETKEKIRTDFKEAWEHHKENNRHHHQTLADYKGDDWKCYVIEMVCDWIAMGWQTGDLAHDYYERNIDTISLPQKYKLFVEEIFQVLSLSDCCANKQLSKEELSKLYFK